MPLFQNIKTFLHDNSLIRRVLRNSGYLFSGNAASAVLNIAQGIFIARLLGGAGLGLLTIIMDFASNTNRLLSFRMSEVVVKYVGEALAQEVMAPSGMVTWAVPSERFADVSPPHVILS